MFGLMEQIVITIMEGGTWRRVLATIVLCVISGVLLTLLIRLVT